MKIIACAFGFICPLLLSVCIQASPLCFSSRTVSGVLITDANKKGLDDVTRYQMYLLSSSAFDRVSTCLNTPGYKPGKGARNLVTELRNFYDLQRRALVGRKGTYTHPDGTQRTCLVMIKNSSSNTISTSARVKGHISAKEFVTSFARVGWDNVIHFASRPEDVYGYGEAGVSIYSFEQGKRLPRINRFELNGDAFQFSHLYFHANLERPAEFGIVHGARNRQYLVTLPELVRQGAIHRVPPLPDQRQPSLHNHLPPAISQGNNMVSDAVYARSNRSGDSEEDGSQGVNQGLNLDEAYRFFLNRFEDK